MGAELIMNGFAIRDLMAHCCQRCDDGNFGLMDVFAPDGIFDYSGQTEGHDALLTISVGCSRRSDAASTSRRMC